MEKIERIIKITEEEVSKYADLTGDYNPIHFDLAFAKSANFKKPIVHGPLLLIKITTLFANDFPGPGTVYLSHEYKFLKPIFANENLTVTLSLLEKNEKNHLFVSTECFNENHDKVFEGIARLKKY